jgi:hypothetical protein
MVKHEGPFTIVTQPDDPGERSTTVLYEGRTAYKRWQDKKTGKKSRLSILFDKWFNRRLPDT